MNLKLLIASTNLNKVREFRHMLKPIKGLDVYSLLDFPDFKPREEVGDSFEEIVSIKALDAAKHTGLLTIADDSGLVVPAIKGEPGVVSARYAGPNASDEDNRRKLLTRMAGLRDDARDGYFICSIALADPDRVIKVVSGKCEGRILDQNRGGNGFGYDPLFLKHDYGKTFAEMDEALKNRISHRHKALDKMMPYLQEQVERHVSHN
jgi:XTP/dITP diphosphohydrolase